MREERDQKHRNAFDDRDIDETDSSEIKFPASYPFKMRLPTKRREQGVCCDHRWETKEDKSQMFMDGTRGTWIKCSACGATCKRDHGGMIIEYDAIAKKRASRPFDIRKREDKKR